MTRANAVLNTLTLFTYLTTHYPKEVINLTQYWYGKLTLTIHCSEMTDQEIEDLSKQLDYLRIDGSKITSRSHVSQYDGKTIKVLELSWGYNE